MSAFAPTACFDANSLVSELEACPVPGFERCVLAAGVNHLTLLGVHAEEGGVALRPVPAMDLTHQGPLEAVAWGHDSATSNLLIAAFSSRVVGIHRLQAGSGPQYAEVSLPPAAAGSVLSCCFLERSADRIALTGDGCSCHVVAVSPGGAASIEQSYELRSPGVAVRAHPREPQQLMIAAEDGHVHFVDLRVPSARPSLSRSLPPSFGLPAGGMRDADWSPYDPYLVGGVCGAHWLAWDLRQPGLSPPPQMGDSHASGGSGFRWSPFAPAFATAGSSNELAVHSVNSAGPAQWSVEPKRLSLDLPTRVSGLSWLRTAAEPMLAAAADTKVCVWSVAGPAERAIV